MRAKHFETSAHGSDGDAEAVASKYMDELAARLLAPAQTAADGEVAVSSDVSGIAEVTEKTESLRGADISAGDGELDSTTAESLEKFMSSLKEHLQLEQDVWPGADDASSMIPSLPAPSVAMPTASTSATTLTDMPAPAQAMNESTSLPASLPLPPRERVHTLTESEHRAKVAHVVREHMQQEAHGTSLAPPLMTKIKCLHASVAQKSYGSEKRFLCPPPVVRVRGQLRHAPSSPMLLMQVQGEDGDSFSGEQMAPLDETGHARFTELHVTGTGKAKSFRLQLHLLTPRDGALPTKRARLGASGDAAAIRSASWASFDSAPIGIISKPSKRIAKARNVSAHITKDTSVSLFNRINSQTYRTKYLCAQGGRLSAQSRAWTAFRLVVLSRREASGPQDMADDSVLTYGSVIVLVDPESGVTTDPLVVCKVDRGRILPPIDGHAVHDDDDGSAWGAVAQMQKVALMRYVPTHGEWTLHAHTPRTYLCAGAPPTAETALSARPDTADDAHSLPLTYASTRPVPWNEQSAGVLDEAEDAICWTLVGISHFEYTFMDVDMLGVPAATASMGLALTPFPLVTTMPFYDAASHKLAMTVQHFFYVRDSSALQTPREAYAATHAPHAHVDALEVWLGPIGPLTLVTVPVPESDEAEVAVQLPRLREILAARLDARSSAPSTCTLPLLFVRAHDSTIYHSGRHVLCQDLVAVVRAAGDTSAANALQKLNVGLGEQAGAHELPAGSVWTLRVI